MATVHTVQTQDSSESKVRTWIRATNQNLARLPPLVVRIRLLHECIARIENELFALEGAGFKSERSIRVLRREIDDLCVRVNCFSRLRDAGFL